VSFGATHKHAALTGGSQEALPVLHCGDKRLFGIDMLAGLDSGKGDLGMRRRDRQVEDAVDLRIDDDLLDRAGARDAVPRRFRPALGHVRAGAGDDIDAIEARAILYVDVTDPAAADQADT